MTIQLTDLLNQVVSKKLDALQEERRKSMHSTSKRAMSLAKPKTAISPEAAASAQRAIELARAEKAKRAGRGNETDDAIAAATAELRAQLSADKEARASGKPSLKRVDIATQAPDDTGYAPSALTGRQPRDFGQDGNEDQILDPDQLGSRNRLGMDETSHKRSVKKLKELKDTTYKSYEKKAKRSAQRELRKSDAREDAAMSTDGEKHPERQEKHIEKSKEHYNKYKKRLKGILAAGDLARKKGGDK